MKNILEDLEILILQNEDDFDRGSGKFILRNFIKEKQAEQLTLTDVVSSLPNKEEPTIKDAFIAGYKKEAIEIIKEAVKGNARKEDFFKTPNEIIGDVLDEYAEAMFC